MFEGSAVGQQQMSSKIYSVTPPTAANADSIHHTVQTIQLDDKFESIAYLVHHTHPTSPSSHSPPAFTWLELILLSGLSALFASSMRGTLLPNPTTGFAFASRRGILFPCPSPRIRDDEAGEGCAPLLRRS